MYTDNSKEQIEKKKDIDATNLPPNDPTCDQPPKKKAKSYKATKTTDKSKKNSVKKSTKKTTKATKATPKKEVAKDKPAKKTEIPVANESVDNDYDDYCDSLEENEYSNTTIDRMTEKNYIQAVKKAINSVRPSSSEEINTEKKCVNYLNQYFSYVLFETDYIVVYQKYNHVLGHNETFYLKETTLNKICRKWPKVVVPKYKYTEHKVRVLDKYVAKNPADVWLESPRGRDSDSLTFDPLNRDPKAFNLWEGYNAEPIANLPLIQPWLDHVFNVICDESHEEYEFFLNWLAHMFQKPWELPRSGIVMVSEQGAGKGLLMEPFRGLLGSMFLHAVRSITGQFNGLLANKLLVFWDECFAGSKEDTDKMKTLITENTMQMELKFKDAIKTPWLGRVVMATNHDHVLSISKSERRYMMLRVPVQKLQNKSYYKALADSMKADGFSDALFHFFINRNIENFDPTNIPKNDEIFTQKIRNLPMEDKFWLETLARWVQEGNGTENIPLIESNMFLNKVIDWRYEQWYAEQKVKGHNAYDNVSYTTSYLIKKMGYLKTYKDKDGKRKVTKWEKQSCYWVQIANDNNSTELSDPTTRQDLLSYLISKTAEHLQVESWLLKEHLYSAKATTDNWNKRTSKEKL